MPAGIDAKHQVISDLIDRQITPLVVKNTMCAYLSIGWPTALVQYKSGVRAAKKRALDTSACTVARKWHRRDGDEEGAGEGAGSGDV